MKKGALLHRFQGVRNYGLGLKRRVEEYYGNAALLYDGEERWAWMFKYPARMDIGVGFVCFPRDCRASTATV